MNKTEFTLMIDDLDDAIERAGRLGLENLAEWLQITREHLVRKFTEDYIPKTPK